MNTHHKRLGINVWRVLLIISICMIITGIMVLLFQSGNRKAASDHLSEIQETVNVTTENDSELDMSQMIDRDPKDQDILTRLGIVVPGKNIDWQELHEQNADIYAWIYVPDTTVDYPIVQHPTDNSYIILKIRI